MRLFRCLASLIASTSLLSLVESHSQARNPLNYLALVENPQIQTQNRRIHAYSHFDLTFDLHRPSQHIKLSLEPNHDILQEDSYVEYLDKHGHLRHAEKIIREHHKVFQGKTWLLEPDGTYSPVGWARIVVRRDGHHPLFEGAFSINGDHHHVQMSTNYLQTKHELDPEIEESDDEYMTLFRGSDISRQAPRKDLKRSLESSCGSDRLSFNRDPNHPVYQNILKRDEGYWGSVDFAHLLGKRQGIDGGGAPGGGNSGGVNLKNSIGKTDGCPSTRKVALLGVATDCTYTAQFNATDSVRANVITQVNTASDLYQSTFNITLGLQNLTVSDAECPSTASASVPWNVGCNSDTIEQRLNLFSQWRGQRPDNNAYWSLFSTCNTGAEVGLAWLGQLCNNQATSQSDTSGSTQTVTGANVIIRTSTEWEVFAHESGHTFGAVHDCDSSTCADTSIVNSQQCCPLSGNTCDANAQYIMNPYSSPGVTTFSPCTVGNICSALGRNSVKSTCLSDNKGVTTISGHQCGNGIVEAGEDCDCGGPEGCAGNTCCDPTTCKFNSGAVCDPSNEGCCTNTCQFQGSGSVCRASTGQCDPAETCSGTNGACPADATAPDGTDCSGSEAGLQCASGQCTSRDLQCKTLMGSYTSNNDTYACNSQTCSLSCASPEFGPNVCYSMQQNFLDGTPCGGGGHCSNGQCDGSTIGGEVKSWIDDNKTIVIALSVVIGVLVILAILSCCIRAFRRPRRSVKGGPGPNGRPRRARPYPPRGGPNGVYGWDGPMPPPAMQQRGYGAPPPFPETYTNGNSGGPQPILGWPGSNQMPREQLPWYPPRPGGPPPGIPPPQYPPPVRPSVRYA